MSSLVRGPVAETLRQIVPSTWTVLDYMTQPDKLTEPLVMLDHISYQLGTVAFQLEATVRVYVCVPWDQTPSSDGRPEQSIEDAVDNATGVAVYALLNMELVTTVSATRTTFPPNDVPCWRIDLTIIVPVDDEPEETPPADPEEEN